MARPNRKPGSPAPAGDDENLVSLGAVSRGSDDGPLGCSGSGSGSGGRGHIGPSEWPDWSSVHDEIEHMVKRILRLPASDVRELNIKFAALWFTLYADRPDWLEARRMANFGRELRRVALASKWR